MSDKKEPISPEVHEGQMNVASEMNAVKKEDVKKEKSFFSKEKMVSLKESEYETLVRESADFKDKYVRLFAEFDNFRKRMEREKQEFAKYANGEVLSQFLSILDDL